MNSLSNPGTIPYNVLAIAVAYNNEKGYILSFSRKTNKENKKSYN